MKKLFIIANWKSNKTTYEAIKWLQAFENLQLRLEADQPLTETQGEKEIIVCPSFTCLASMKAYISQQNLSIKLGAQDISPFSEGAYTGEISSKQAVELVTHAIVGHSERRKYFHETDDDVIEEISRLLEDNIAPILCVSNMSQMDYYLMKGRTILDNADKIIFVYEPPSAISGGGAFHPEDPDAANQNAAEISGKIGKKVITLYGGSVNSDNAGLLFSKDSIDGGLIGQASLDPEKFIQIIKST